MDRVYSGNGLPVHTLLPCCLAPGVLQLHTTCPSITDTLLHTHVHVHVYLLSLYVFIFLYNVSIALCTAYGLDVHVHVHVYVDVYVHVGVCDYDDKLLV